MWPLCSPAWPQAHCRPSCHMGRGVPRAGAVAGGSRAGPSSPHRGFCAQGRPAWLVRRFCEDPRLPLAGGGGLGRDRLPPEGWRPSRGLDRGLGGSLDGRGFLIYPQSCSAPGPGVEAASEGPGQSPSCVLVSVCLPWGTDACCHDPCAPPPQGWGRSVQDAFLMGEGQNPSR